MNKFVEENRGLVGWGGLVLFLSGLISGGTQFTLSSSTGEVFQGTDSEIGVLMLLLGFVLLIFYMMERELFALILFISSLGLFTVATGFILAILG